MNDYERYRFDVDGFLVMPGVVGSDEIDRLRAEVAAAGIADALEHTPSLHAGFPSDYFDDATWAGEHGPRYGFEPFMLDWGPAVRSLVADPRLAPYLEALVGPAYRLDHAYGVFARGVTGAHPLHGGATPFDPAQSYVFRDGTMHNSMIGVQVALTDAAAGDGGFCCVPGSHKANYPLPPEVASLVHRDDVAPELTEVALAAGDVLVFSEALTHGSRGWRGAGDRWVLLYKYCPGWLQWERSSPFVSPGHEWQPWQARALDAPFVGGRRPVRDP